MEIRIVMDKLSFVIPCYRSEKTVGYVIEEIIQQMKKSNRKDFEIILVNDCSPDETWKKNKRTLWKI